MNRAAASLALRATGSFAAGWRNTTAPLARVASGSKKVHPPTATSLPATTSSPLLQSARAFTTVFGKYYHIEASNAERDDATKLTVRGPDVDGILASMTVVLAVKGCSLVELHAGHAMDCSHNRIVEDTHFIKDVFYVVNRTTGQQFPDNDLETLAQALLEAAKSPMKAVTSMNGAKHVVDDIEAHLKEHVTIPETQITVIPSGK